MKINFSNEINPVHGYAQEGEYVIILRVWNSCDTVQATGTVNWFFPLLAGFFVPDIARACEAVALVFENEISANTKSYSWSFPGGTPDQSNEEHPVVTYTQTGDHALLLTFTTA